ncbi:MAG: hypothetical protein U0637_01590 [Phycisphaerales bacterium]
MLACFAVGGVAWGLIAYVMTSVRAFYFKNSPSIQPAEFIPSALCLATFMVLCVKREWLRYSRKWAYWTIAWLGILAAVPVTVFVLAAILKNL